MVSDAFLLVAFGFATAYIVGLTGFTAQLIAHLMFVASTLSAVLYRLAMRDRQI